MDWSTLSCGRSGHLTFAPDEPDLAAQMGAVLPDGPAWQCLRCGSYVVGPPTSSGPAATAPVVPRGREIRSNLILRVFAVERFLRGLLVGAGAVLLWQYRHSQTSIERRFDRELPVIRGIFRQLGFNISNSKLVGLLQHALTLSTRTLTLLAIGLAVYAVIELVEGTGLWLARRWGEYFAMVATSLGLPLEIYDLSRKFTATALVLLLINLALVLYLVITKRLFGVRGGKRAYDARLWSESVLEAAEAAAAARQAALAGAHAPADGSAAPTAASGSGGGPPGGTVSVPEAASAPQTASPPGTASAPEAASAPQSASQPGTTSPAGPHPR